jgi:hypothetical protein
MSSKNIQALVRGWGPHSFRRNFPAAILERRLLRPWIGAGGIVVIWLETAKSPARC